MHRKHKENIKWQNQRNDHPKNANLIRNINLHNLGVVQTMRKSMFFNRGSAEH